MEFSEDPRDHLSELGKRLSSQLKADTLKLLEAIYPFPIDHTTLSNPSHRLHPTQSHPTSPYPTPPHLATPHHTPLHHTPPNPTLPHPTPSNPTPSNPTPSHSTHLTPTHSASFCPTSVQNRIQLSAGFIITWVLFLKLLETVGSQPFPTRSR